MLLSELQRIAGTASSSISGPDVSCECGNSWFGGKLNLVVFLLEDWPVKTVE